jgi:hypothetical protein
MGIKTTLAHAGFALSLMAAAASASADIVVRTGVDNANAVMVSGSIDADWTISTNGGSTFLEAKVLYPIQACCGMDSVAGTAAWISDPSIVAGSAATSWGVSNTVYLRHSFDLSGYDLATVAFSGIWRVADNTLGIYLNGDLISGTTLGSTWFSDWALSVGTGSSSFLQGVNTLEVRANSINSSWDGLWMDGTVTGRQSGTVPVPATLALAVLGLGLVAAQRRRVG